MIDHLAGRPNPSWKRAQVFLVIFFWLFRIVKTNPGGPRLLWLRRANRSLQKYTPWQIVATTLTAIYTIRNFDNILGLSAPEPLARLYSPSYYRATWINTGLDAGFATAMSIRPKWLNDICSVMFSVYYIVYANEADEKLRKFRAVPTIEMLRSTWEKTTNPYIRFVTHLRLPRMSIRRKILLPRPKSSIYKRPITAYLFFAPPEEQLSRATDLILDYPGGGFVAMGPEHHEERLRMWAVRTGKPVLSIEYGKAPEYPYPFAIDESFDTYRLLVESAGTNIGMSGRKLNVIMTGDSAGATLAVSVMIKILEHNASIVAAGTIPSHPIPSPLALVLNYAALDFNFTSWMTPANLRVLRSEHSSGNLPGLKELALQKDHLGHVSPLSMVGDKRLSKRGKGKLKRQMSWRDTIRGLTSNGSAEEDEESSRRSKPARKTSKGYISAPDGSSSRMFIGRSKTMPNSGLPEDRGVYAEESDEDDDEDGRISDFRHLREQDRPIEARVKHVYHQGSGSPPGRLKHTPSALEREQEALSAAIAEADSKAILAPGGLKKAKDKEGEPIGTRLTMTSRTGYFQDRVISPSMMRAMAILYIGPHRNPDFATDYHISPILAPSHLLAQFPPLLMQCGEKDPFVDDTVIFAGRVREAKRARKVELDLAIAGKSARFGEALRMSQASVDASISTPLDGARLSALKKERDQLARETEEDWVQMVLFSDWSHGYLQMTTLMTEAKAVIEDLGDWIDEAFYHFTAGWERRQDERPPIPPLASHSSKPERRRASLSRRQQQPGMVDSTMTAPSPFGSETETDDSAITFVAKRRRASFEKGGAAPGSSWSDETLRDESNDQGIFTHTGKPAAKLRTMSSEPKVGGSEPALGDIVEDGDEGKPHRGAPPGWSGGNKTAGQTISETELMRRRRLLDAHIFD